MSATSSEPFAAIPYRNTPVVDGTWDGPGQEAKIPNDAGASTLRRMYAWVDPDGDPDTKAAYKFPHHEVTDGTPGAANVNGVRNALSRLPQANIPEGDRAAVERHLQAHLDRYNREHGGENALTRRLLPGVFALAEPTTQNTDVEMGAPWHSDIAFEGLSTGDGRFMVPGAISHRELPLTLMAMTETADGHDGAEVSGRIDTMTRRDVNMDGQQLPDGVRAFYSTGVFDTGAFAQDIQRLVGNRTLRGVSVDLAIMAWAFRDPETGEIIDPDTATADQWDKAFMGDYEFAVTDGEVMAATVCPTPAFADARIALIAAAVVPMARRVWIASDEYAAQHGVRAGQLMTTLVASVALSDEPEPEALVASGGLAPIAPPLAWFERPEPDEPTPLTVTDDGEVYGHIALWDTCHTGFMNGQWSECITPPRSTHGYSDFHLGALVTEEGHEISVGKLTVGTGHAPISANRRAAVAHYDNTGAVAAFVRAANGRYGVWVSGATRSDATPEQIRDLRANPPSGDWRDSEGSLELQAALAVPIPGFPVRRSQMALAASGDQLRVVSLILAAGIDVNEDAAATDALEWEIRTQILAAAIDGPEALDDMIQADAA